MGIYSTAHLVCGWKVDSAPFIERVDEEYEGDFEAWIDERLRGSCVGYYFDGSYDWGVEERDLILTVGGVISHSACEGTKRLEALPAWWTIAGEIEEAQRAIKERLGLEVHDCAWFLGCSVG